MGVMNVPLMAQRILIRDDVMNPHVQVGNNDNEKSTLLICHMNEKLKNITQ